METSFRHDKPRLNMRAFPLYSLQRRRRDLTGHAVADFTFLETPRCLADKNCYFCNNREQYQLNNSTAASSQSCPLQPLSDEGGGKPVRQ